MTVNEIHNICKPSINYHIFTYPQFIDKNLEPIAVCGNSIVIQQKPINRTIHFHPQPPSLEKKITLYLAFPYMIYIINKDHLYVYFTKTPITNINQEIYSAYLLNVDHNNQVCQKSPNWNIIDIINTLWESSFNTILSTNVTSYNEIFPLHEWHQLTKTNPNHAIEKLNQILYSTGTLKRVLEHISNWESNKILSQIYTDYKINLIRLHKPKSKWSKLIGKIWK